MLSKALLETYKAKALEPKKYFAKYLLNYAAQKRKQSEVSSNNCFLRGRYILTETNRLRQVPLLIHLVL